jgi:hypothetical protein
MAHTDDIPEGAIKEVVRQVSDLVERGLEKDLLIAAPPADVGDMLGDISVEHPLTMQDSFSIWELDEEALDAVQGARAEGDLSAWARPAGQLYHQIFLKGEPKAFARSEMREGGSGEETLSQLNVSPLAARVEGALRKIKENRERDEVVAADPVVRMLELPSYHILALWLYAEALRQSRVLIIIAPKRYGESWAGSFLTTERFFDGLRIVGPLAGTA